MLILPVQHVVAQIHGGNFARQARVVALGGRQGAVAGVFRPAHVEDDRVGAFTVLIHVVAIRARRVGAEPAELVVFEADAREDAVVLGNGYPEVQAAAIRRDLVITPRIAGVPGFGTAVVQRSALADAV